VIIHGTGGKPDGNWFPWLRTELAAQGYEAIAPTFPTIEGQTLENWRKAFHEQVGPVSANLILIGHSIGAGFILNLLETASQPVLGSFFVAGFIGKIGLPEYDALNASFVCRNFNWQAIRKNLGYACILHSDKDLYVDISKAEELSQQLQVPVTLVPGAGHFNYESGYYTFPLLLEQLKNCLPARV
jgi:predicted alpha/beta hydrolase family esterase